MTESKGIAVTIQVARAAPITDHPQTPDSPEQAVLVQMFKDHKHTGIKGTSWDDPAGYRQTCACGWGKSYRGGYSQGAGLWEKHMADVILEALPAITCMQIAAQYQEKVTAP
jgi:hypothetical protein